MKIILIVTLSSIYLCLSCKKEKASLVIYNNSFKSIDSVNIFLNFSDEKVKDTIKIMPNDKRIYQLDLSKQDIKNGIETTNSFSYYVSNKEFKGTWGLVDGWLSVQKDTIYVLNGGWSHVNDSTKLCCK